MKNLGYFLFLLVLCMSCATKLHKTATFKYSNVEFTPMSADRNIADDVSLTVEPIDANSINHDVFESLQADGGYEREHLSYYTYITRDRSSLTSVERNTLKRLEERYNTVSELQDEGEISDLVGAYFKQMIYSKDILGSSYGWDGSEIGLFLGNEYYANLNPYRIDKKYLSLFRLTLNNKSSDVHSLIVDNFQISSGTEQLYPFKIDYFETTIKGENEKLKYIYRMNMPNDLKVTPGQKVEKFISTPAIKTSSQALTVSYVTDGKVVDYPFDVAFETIEKKQDFTGYSFVSPGKTNHVIVELSNGALLPLKNNVLYINDNNSDNRVKVYALGYVQRFVYYAEMSFVPAQLKKHKIRLPYKSR